MSIIEKIKKTKTVNPEDLFELCEEFSTIEGALFILKVNYSEEENKKYRCVISFPEAYTFLDDDPPWIRKETNHLRSAVVWCVLKYVKSLKRKKSLLRFFR